MYNFCKLYIHKATRSYCFLYLKSQRLVSLLSSITQQPQVWNHCGQTTLRDLSRWLCQKMTRSEIRHSQQMKSGNERSQTSSCLWPSQTTLNVRYFKEMENYGICTILFVAFFLGGYQVYLGGCVFKLFPMTYQKAWSYLWKTHSVVAMRMFLCARRLELGLAIHTLEMEWRQTLFFPLGNILAGKPWVKQCIIKFIATGKS